MSAVPPRRPIVLKASRDTLVLLAGATALTLAIGYSVHSRPTPDPAVTTVEQTAAGEWAGQLAGLPPAAKPNPSEPLSSAALTVPKAAMALPAPPRAAPPAAATAVKPRLCDGTACPPAKLAAAPAAAVRRPAPAPVREASLMERLNPLNHLPDMVKRPFASAGDTIAGWAKRF